MGRSGSEIKLACTELELRNRLFQENHGKVCQEIEERICGEEIEQTIQARSEELSLQQRRKPTTVSQMMCRIQDLQNKVNSVSDAREFYDLESRSSSGATHVLVKKNYDSESQDHASLRFWIAAWYTELCVYCGKRF